VIGEALSHYPEIKGNPFLARLDATREELR
jgi:hypothetical protein